MLSAKLYENKLIIVDKCELEVPRTKLLNHFLKPFKHKKLLFITPQDADENFELAVRNLPYKNTCMANSINVSKMIKHDFLVIPKQGLIGKPLTSRLGDHP